jgi:hypothetical protein
MSGVNTYRIHKLSHEKLFFCDVPGCSKTKGFSDVYSVKRHKITKHQSAGKRYRCYIQGCKSGDKSWPLLDNFRSHIKKMHKEEFAEEGEFSKIAQR